MLKELIIIENGKEYQFSTLEEIVKALIDSNYYEMSKEQRIKRMKMLALANSINNKVEIEEKVVRNSEIEGKFIIKDEITYILSLLVMNKILLLERKDANVFTTELDKSNMKDNYIIVNTFAKILLREYIEKL
ncbi:MAG: hypothetical protein IKD76_06175 [Clostridia bacterium]|nr:hypothetical protein [Clostridia bacterium]